MSRALICAAVLACGFAPLSARAGDPPSALVCTYQQDIGSHLKKRTCTTQSARVEQQKAARDSVARAGANQDTRAAMSGAQASRSGR